MSYDLEEMQAIVDERPAPMQKTLRFGGRAFAASMSAMALLAASGKGYGSPYRRRPVAQVFDHPCFESTGSLAIDARKPKHVNRPPGWKRKQRREAANRRPVYHLYQNDDGEIMSAETREAAARMHDCEWGGHPEPLLSTWRQIPDGALIRGRDESPADAPIYTKTAAAWAAETGAGMFSSTYA